MHTTQPKIDAMYRWLDRLTDTAHVTNEREFEAWIIEMGLRVGGFCRQLEHAAQKTEGQRNAEDRKAAARGRIHGHHACDRLDLDRVGSDLELVD